VIASRSPAFAPPFRYRRLLPMLGLVLAALAAPAAARETPTDGAPRPFPPTPGIYRLADLNRVGAARIPRATTYLLQQIDPLDNHGAHLPAGTNFFLSGALVDALAERLRDVRPDWSVLILPPLPLGSGLVGELGGIEMHTSAQGVSSTDLRRVVANWGLHPGESAYPNLFFVSINPDPLHHRALNDVSDFYYGNYGMYGGSVLSFVLADSAVRADLVALGEKRFGRVPEADPVLQLYGGLAETSLMLHLMPEKVDPSYAELPLVGASSWSDLPRIVHQRGWEGYIGNPARATPEYGAELWERLVDAGTRFIVETADRTPTNDRPRLEDVLNEDFELREAYRRTRRMYDRHRLRQDTFFQRRAAEENKAHGEKWVEP
jgi:creatinine amidohydrolase